MTPPADVDIAVNLHRLVGSNAPRATPVEALPEQYMQMYWQPFPIPPEVVPPGGLADVLAREFGHLFTFSKNRAGAPYVSTVMPADTPLDQVARLHIEARMAQQPPPPVSKKAPAKKPTPVAVAKAVAPAAQVPAGPSPVKLSADEEASAQTLLKGLHCVLVGNSKLGDAQSMEELRRNLQLGFFELFQLPLVLSSSKIADPIELVLKGQMKCFTRLLQDPLNGTVSVKALTENVQIPQIGSLTHDWMKAPRTTVPPSPDATSTVKPAVDALFKRLRDQLVENLSMVDGAIANPNLNVPDVKLWTQALETLCHQERQTRDILKGLI